MTILEKGADLRAIRAMPVDDAVEGQSSLPPCEPDAVERAVDEVLEEQFGVPTEFIDPLRRVQFSESSFAGQWLRSIAPTLSVASRM